jgi:hypothetical protein
LKQLSAQVTALGGQSILKQIDDKKSDLLARNAGLDIVECDYYRTIALDYLSHSKPEYYDSIASNY